ncbi:hypothetical protein [Desulfonatronospira sp.]|uniref:hypothetical protein n=1 Tax=Desulfonatronospira sp. TaxID=1962951 RepID=UPI0025C0A03A|nr:hypothetical protein [Desulfonatronospira sp.]
MKKIICITVIYLFVLVAPLNSSEFAQPVSSGSTLIQGSEARGSTELADNLSFISSGVVNTIMSMLGD